MTSPSPRTLLGPLTTAFTVPGICSEAMALCPTCTTLWRAQTCNPSSLAHDWTSCWPPRSGSATRLDPGVMMGWGFYSPGYICPAGYTTAALATFSESGSGASDVIWGVQFSLTAGETAAACCPSGFAVGSVVATDKGTPTSAQTCVRVVMEGTFSTVMCSEGRFTGFGEVTVPNTVDGRTLETYTVWAPLVQVNWREGDVPKTSGDIGPAATSSGTGSGTTITETLSDGQVVTVVKSTGGAVSTSRAAGGLNTDSGASSSRLSTGAKVGIGVGAAAGALLFMSLVCFLLWRRRHDRDDAQGASGLLTTQDRNEKTSLPDQQELGGTEVRELEGQGVPAELPTRGPSHRTVEGMAMPNFRRSEQSWVVSPGTDGTETWSSNAGAFVSPVEPHVGAVFELEGDGTPRSTQDEPRDR